ncbi:MAG TPA: isoprenylcysteine carboxylmethyltransferase family protein, partial [Polyangia bacterium]
MRSAAITGFRLVAYVAFAASFAWLFAFVGDLFITRTVDWGRPVPLAEALAVDVGWFVLFGVQHSTMARAGVKARLVRVVPPELERSLFVLVSALLLLLLLWQWRPLPAVVWDVQSSPWRQLLVGLYLAGWLQTVASSFFIDHFAMFGVRDERERPFGTPYLYRAVRHPIYLGFLVVFWATPRMTVGHLVLAIGMSTYMIVGIRFEERDLVRRFGDAYRDYQARVPMLVPITFPY